MERTEFVNTIKEITTEFGEATIQTINKSGYSYEGLFVRKIGAPTPVVNLDDLYERYQNGTSLAECIDIARDILGRTADEIPVDVSRLSEYEYIKDKLYLRLMGTINEDENEYRKIADMYLVPYADLGNGSTFRIPYGLIKSWDIDINEVYEQAKTNQEIIRPATIKNLAEMMGVPDNDIGVYVISTKDGYCGASAILYEGMVDKIRDKIGDFYILPSSIHEVIVIPKKFTTNIDKLKAIVSLVNAESVSGEDKLTDSVYEYNFENRELVQVA